MGTIKINQKLKHVEISSFELNNEIVFNYFDKLTVSERDDKLIRPIYQTLAFLRLFEGLKDTDFKGQYLAQCVKV